MTRTVRAATISANTTKTAMTMRATMMTGSSFLVGSNPTSVSMHYQSRRATYFNDFDAFARIERLIFVEAARGPPLALDLHATDPLVVGDPLQDDRLAAYERRGACADGRGKAAMTARDRPQCRKHYPRGEQEDDRGEQRSHTQQAHNRRERSSCRERRQVETALVHLPNTQDARHYQPEHPCVHDLIIPQPPKRGRNRLRRTVVGPPVAHRSRLALRVARARVRSPMRSLHVQCRRAW